MPKGILPGDPPRSDHRFIKDQLQTTFSKKHIHPDPEAFDRISRVFAQAGGSWERIFLGSVEDIQLLRRVIKAAIRCKVLQRAPKWS